MTLQETIEQIHPLSKEAMDRAKAHWDGIAKPLHSLGKLEDVLIQIAGITGKEEISIEKRALLTFCADNGVVEENVTQSGQEVTATVAENFLQENGYKSDFPDYCFTAKTWLEDKERFFQVLRPLLKNPAGEGMSQEEGLTYYQELFTKMTAGLSDRKKAEVRQLCEYYRTYHVQRERTQYLWEGCFYACRKRLKRIAGILSVPEEDLLYLRYEELQNVIRNGAVPDREREIISRRKEYRPLVEAYW